MMRNAGFGWSVVRILGRIYAILGAAFLAAGMLLGTLVQHLSGAILMLVGTPFLVIGLVLLAVDRCLEKRRKALIESGRFVWAEVTDCVYNYSISFHNGIHPYQIVACYAGPDGVRHLFRSQNVPLCGPRELIGKSVRVYHDEGFRHYYVDALPLTRNYVMH